MSHELAAALLVIASVAVCIFGYFYDKETMKDKKVVVKKITEEPIRQTFKPKRDPKYREGKPFIDAKEKLPRQFELVEIQQVGGLCNRAYLDRTKYERIDIWVVPMRGIYLGLPDVVGWREIE